MFEDHWVGLRPVTAVSANHGILLRNVGSLGQTKILGWLASHDVPSRSIQTAYERPI